MKRWLVILVRLHDDGKVNLAAVYAAAESQQEADAVVRKTCPSWLIFQRPVIVGWPKEEDDHYADVYRNLAAERIQTYGVRATVYYGEIR